MGHAVKLCVRDESSMLGINALQTVLDCAVDRVSVLRVWPGLQGLRMSFGMESEWDSSCSACSAWHCWLASVAPYMSQWVISRPQRKL